MINNIQNRGTTFPASIKNTHKTVEASILMDTGATKSCMNYNTAYKLGKEQIKQFNGWSQNTVPIASTQAAIKGIVQYSTRAHSRTHTVSQQTQSGA